MLNDIKEGVLVLIRIIAIENYIRYIREEKEITQRMYDLLLLLRDIGPGYSFTMNSLFKEPVFTILYPDVTLRTAQRDLKNLTDTKLLIKGEDKNFKLNISVLGAF